MKFKVGDKVRWIDMDLIGTVIFIVNKNEVLCEFENWHSGHNGGILSSEVPETDKKNRWWIGKDRLKKVKERKE